MSRRRRQYYDNDDAGSVISEGSVLSTGEMQRRAKVTTIPTTTTSASTSTQYTEITWVPLPSPLQALVRSTQAGISQLAARVNKDAAATGRDVERLMAGAHTAASKKPAEPAVTVYSIRHKNAKS